TGDRPIAILNEEEADNYGIHPGDRVSLIWSKNRKITVAVDVSNKQVKPGQIGLFKDLWHKKEVEDGDIVEAVLESRPLSIETIKKKMLGRPASYDEIYAIIDDIVNGKLGEVEITYFVSTSFVKSYSDEEIYYLSKAMAETGDQFDLKMKSADKHSVGGLPGNRTTPIIVPIIASLDICIPNTSSRAITSPAGTADVMEVLCPVSFSLEEIKKIVRKTNGCLVWGGGLHLAPADDKIIKINRPLGLEPYDKMVVSIMAKKVATGVDSLVIDIPVGENCKVPKMKYSRQIEKKFEFLAKKFKMKIKVLPNSAKEPVGQGIGPALEARDCLRVLQQYKYRPMDLENKSVKQAGILLELHGHCKPGQGREIAQKQLKTGKAWKKMNEIIVAQGGKNDINSEEVMQEIRRYEIHAHKNGKITFVNNRAVTEICQNLGAPLDKFAGIHLHVSLGQKVKKGEKLFTMYASSEERLKLGLLASKSNLIHVIK
ncbi:MAG: thymidine phosphorylase, partial [Parcubacteria group bacterium]